MLSMPLNARAMRKQSFISWVGLVPTIELCRAGAYGRILTDGCRACTLMTGARSNPPYIHLHLSFSPLCPGSSHEASCIKSGWDALATVSSSVVSCSLARTVADQSIFRRFFQKHPSNIAAPKNGSAKKKKKAICPDLFHRSVIDALFLWHVFSVFATG